MISVTSKRATDHLHPVPPFLAALPAVADQIGLDARAHVEALLTIAVAKCERCRNARLRHLGQQQRLTIPAAPVRQETTDGVTVRSVTVGGEAAQEPGPAEAVYADLLHTCARMLATLADQRGESQVAFTEDIAAQFCAGMPPELRQQAELVLQTTAGLVRQDCDPVVALELAQGVITMFNLHGTDGHAMLIAQIDLAVGALGAIASS